MTDTERDELREALQSFINLYSDDKGMDSFPDATQVELKSTTFGMIRKARAALSRLSAQPEAKDARELSDAIAKLYADATHCPNCPDQGWFVGGAIDDPEQEQCEYCYTVETSYFNVKEKVRELLAARLASARAQGDNMEPKRLKEALERGKIKYCGEPSRAVKDCAILTQAYYSTLARAEQAERKGEELREALEGARIDLNNIAVGGMTPAWYERKAREGLSRLEAALSRLSASGQGEERARSIVRPAAPAKEDKI
jgi:hypothetical protein